MKLASAIETEAQIIRPLSVEDLPQVLALESAVNDHIDDPDILRPIGQDIIEARLGRGHDSIGAFTLDGDLMAYCTISYPSIAPTEDYLGDGIVDEQQAWFSVNVTRVMVDPKFRGRRLQQFLQEQGLAEAARQGYKEAFATVSPKKPHSLRNFERCGFRIAKTVEKYGGMMRHVLHKTLPLPY